MKAFRCSSLDVEVVFMSYTSPYNNRYQALQPIPLMGTIGMVLISLLFGSILAVLFSWAWLVVTVTMLAAHAMRPRHKSKLQPKAVKPTVGALNGSTS
jgi:multidrug efflux pump subunit AcrB